MINRSISLHVNYSTSHTENAIVAQTEWANAAPEMRFRTRQRERGKEMKIRSLKFNESRKIILQQSTFPVK
jgi:hypothetical protein